MTELLAILALTCSGLVWTLGGYLSNWRKNKDSPDWAGFDKKKLRDDAILGTVLGVGAFIYGSYIGDLPDVTSLTGFVTAAFTGFGTVAIVDKYIIGFIAGK